MDDWSQVGGLTCLAETVQALPCGQVLGEEDREE